jgi:hypothetical protein
VEDKEVLTMQHRLRNTTSTIRTDLYKNVVYDKRTKRWYVHVKVYAENASEAVAIRARLLGFINSIVMQPCTVENNALSLGDESRVLDAHPAPSTEGVNDDDSKEES